MNTVPQIVDRLGRQEIIDRLGVRTSSVTDAISDGVFPARWYGELKEMADEQGIELPLELFNWRKASGGPRIMPHPPAHEHAAATASRHGKKVTKA